MRVSAFAFVVSLSSVALARQLDPRQLNSLPDCAKSCVSDNFDGCNSLDIACICGKQNLISNLSCCVSKACDAEDIEFTISFAQKLCSTYNIALPTAAGCTGSSNSSSTATATSTATSTASSSGSSTSSTAASSSNNAAAPQSPASAMGIGALFAGLVALL